MDEASHPVTHVATALCDCRQGLGDPNAGVTMLSATTHDIDYHAASWVSPAKGTKDVEPWGAEAALHPRQGRPFAGRYPHAFIKTTAPFSAVA